MLTSSKTSNNNNNTRKGAIDSIAARNHVKLKSASIEAANQSSTSLSLPFNHNYDTLSAIETLSEQTLKDNSASSSPALNLEAKKSSTLSPCSVGSPLKPSVSTSCLAVTTKDAQGSSEALVCLPTRASLTHEWKKLKTPNKCRECNVLVYFNGRECSFCGFVAHKKCVTVLVLVCTSRKVKPVVQPIFGQPIVDNNQVVDFMRRFIYEIDSRGLTSKGIYRVSSIKSKVDKLCNYFDQNLPSLVDLSSFHPNIIANALKMYLRQLPEPLFTHQLYQQFIELAKKYPSSNSNKNSKGNTVSASSSNKIASSIVSSTPTTSLRVEVFSVPMTSVSKPRKPFSMPVTLMSNLPVNNNPSYNPLMIAELREVLEQLPAINRQLIAMIMRHLKRVDDMSDENQMSAKNLSIIFGPTLLSADNKSVAIVDNIHQARIVELMITWANQIFPQYENYESKAVIELDFSDDEVSGQLNLAQHRNSNSKEKKSDKQRGSVGRKNSGIKQLKLSTASFLREGLRDTTTKLKNDKQSNKQAITDISDLYEDKPRIDLRELRRQFFTTNPAVQTNQNQEVAVTTDTKTPSQSPVFSPSISPSRTPPAAQINKQAKPGQTKPKSFNPPGSVPVIKVQPCYCNTLTKFAYRPH